MAGKVVDPYGGAQLPKRQWESAINSNDSFMTTKWYQIEGLITRNSNLAKKIKILAGNLNFGGKFEFFGQICHLLDIRLSLELIASCVGYQN